MDNQTKFCRSACVIVVWLMVGMTGQAQLPPYSQYTISDGLISDMVYDIHQDKQGYLWFATEAGLSRLDGYQFSNFTTDDGLPVNEVLDIQEDSKGRLWCMTFPSFPTFFENGKFVHSRNAPWMKPAESPAFYFSFSEDAEGDIWLVDKDGKVFHLDLEEQETRIFSPEEMGTAPFYIWKDQEEQLWVLGREKCLRWNGNEFATVSSSLLPSRPALFTQRDGSFMGVLEASIVEYRGGQQVVHLEDSLLLNFRVHDFFTDSKGSFWLATTDGILRYTLVGGTWTFHEHLLAGEGVSRVIGDNEGNIWVSTLGKGIFFFPSFDLTSIRPMDDQNLGFFCLEKGLDGNILVGGQKFWGEVRNGLLKGSNLPMVEKHPGQVSQILALPSGHTFIITPNILFHSFPNGELRFHYTNSKGLGLGPNGTVMLADRSVIYQFHPEEDLPLYFNRDTAFCNTHVVFEQRVFDLLRSPDQRFLALDQDQMYFFNGEEYQPAKEQIPVGGSILRKMHFDIEGDLWLLMEGKGVAHKYGGKWSLVSPAEGLSSTLMFSISDGPGGSVLVGTQKGLNQVSRNADGSYKVSCFDAYDGLPSNVIYDVLYHHDSIWVATPSGLVSFRPEHMLHHPYDPPIHFTSFTVNNVKVPLDSELIFAHDENQIAIGFKGISFRHGGRMRYRYRIEGKKGDWTSIDFPQVDFPQLAPGEYHFEVQPIRKDGEPGQHVASLAFVIRKPFWTTWWFQASFGMACMLFVAFVFRIRVLTFNRDVVKELLEVVLRKFRPTGFLIVKSNGLTIRIPHPEIFYLEAMGDYIKVVTSTHSHVVHSSLKKMRGELPENEFIRIHRSYIVRLDQVNAAKGKKTVVLGEKELPIGRTYKEKVASALAKILPG